MGSKSDVQRNPCQDAPKRPKDCLKMSQDGPRGVRRRPQDAVRRIQEWKIRDRFGIEKRFPAEPLQTSILSYLGVDFGRFWDRFFFGGGVEVDYASRWPNTDPKNPQQPPTVPRMRPKSDQKRSPHEGHCSWRRAF